MLQEIEKELTDWMREFDTLSNEYRDISLDAATKRDALDLKRAQVMLRAPKDYTVDMKKAHVTELCHMEETECHIAETQRDWYKERLRALAGLLNASQSKAALLREDMKLTNTPRY